MSWILFLLLAAPQDLLERNRTVPAPGSRIRGNRLDLSMGPIIDPDRCTIRPGKIGVDLKVSPDFACGTFDISAGFRSIFNRNMREEMLGALIQEARAELAGSAMVLACQMSPTMCDALKHYKMVSSDALSMQFEQCRAVESAASGINETLRARSIKQCLSELQAKGVPLDEALRECQKSEDLRDLSGNKVKEIDLMKEVGQALGLSPESKSLLGDLAGGLKMGSRGVNGELKLRPVGDTFDRIRALFEQTWSKAVEESTAGAVTAETLRGLAPRGAPPVTMTEVTRLSTMEEADRRVVIGALSSAMALQETARHLSEVQGAIESADALTQDPALRDALRAEAGRLSAEFKRLREEFELSEIVSAARLRADGQAKLAGARAMARASEPDRQAARNQDLRRDTAPWGSGCPMEKKK